MDNNWIGVVATSAVVAAVVAGVFTLATQIYKEWQHRRTWARTQKYEVYARFLSIINQMSVLNPEADLDELFELQAKIELLFDKEKYLRQLHATLRDLTELYHNRPSSRNRKEYDAYQTQLEKASRMITRLLRKDIE